MGIRHFYAWYKRDFSGCVSAAIKEPDVLAIDINGLFYECAQDIHIRNDHTCLFRKICDRIEWIRRRVDPQKMFIICVDGVAGRGKMNLQRQRRMNPCRNRSILNYNHFTPGTLLLHHLTKYIDWYIKMMMTYSTEWQQLKVIYSNEKVPGEGEHKAVSLLKAHVPLCMSVCMYGSDADIILLGTLLPHRTVTIARETDVGIEYIEIYNFKKKLLQRMRWCGNNHNPKQALIDFVFLCILLGNDYLPPVPSLDISSTIIDLMLDVYRQIGCEHGHLTEEIGGAIHGRTQALCLFLQRLSQNEKSLLESHTRNPHVRHIMSKGTFDFDRHRISYYRRFRVCPSTFTHYLDGMFWCINYYQYGMPDWQWSYCLPVSPFLTDIAESSKGYHSPQFCRNLPMPPFLQLLMLLPYHDQHLLPKCMRNSDFHLRKQNSNSLEELYKAYENEFLPKERKRNRVGRPFVYVFQPHCQLWRTVYSCYGSIINCAADVRLL